MVKNEQAIRAFREMLTQIETVSVRADAIFEIMLERSQIHPLELEQVIEAAKDRQRAKWARIRANMDSLLEEEVDKAAARIA
jgi:hypothetical protein